MFWTTKTKSSLTDDNISVQQKGWSCSGSGCGESQTRNMKMALCSSAAGSVVSQVFHKVRIVALISLSDRPVSHQRTWGKTDSVGRLRTWGWYSTAAALTRLRLLSLLKIQGFRTQLWLLPGSNRGIWTLKWSHMDEREEGFCLLEGMRISRRHQLSRLVSDHFHLAAIQSRYSRFLCMCLCMCVFVSVCLRARVCVIGNSDGFAGSFTSKTTATDGWTNPLLWLSGSDAHIHACAHIHTLTHTHSLQNTTWPATV